MSSSQLREIGLACWRWWWSRVVNILRVETKQSFVIIILFWPDKDCCAVAEPSIILLTPHQLVQCTCCTGGGILLYHLCCKVPSIGNGMILWPLEIKRQFCLLKHFELVVIVGCLFSVTVHKSSHHRRIQGSIPQTSSPRVCCRRAP